MQVVTEPLGQPMCCSYCWASIQAWASAVAVAEAPVDKTLSPPLLSSLELEAANKQHFEDIVVEVAQATVALETVPFDAFDEDSGDAVAVDQSVVQKVTELLVAAVAAVVVDDEDEHGLPDTDAYLDEVVPLEDVAVAEDDGDDDADPEQVLVTLDSAVES